jgi:hypothetical protein
VVVKLNSSDYQTDSSTLASAGVFLYAGVPG